LTAAEAEVWKPHVIVHHLRSAQGMCANFNPDLTERLSKTVAAWQARQSPEVTGEMGYKRRAAIALRTDTASRRALRVALERSLAERLTINNASRAGCEEFMRLADGL
jgi:hypothetical protein